MRALDRPKQSGPKLFPRLLFALAALTWLGTLIAFCYGALLPVPEQQFVSKPERSILLGLKGVQSLGSETLDTFSSADTSRGVILGSSRHKGLSSSKVTWTLNSRTMSRFVSNSDSWSSKVVIDAFQPPRAYVPGGSFDVYVNGTLRAHVPLDVASFEKGGLRAFLASPRAMPLEAIPFAWAFRPYCNTVPLTANDLTRDEQTVTLETDGYALWSVRSVFMYTTFVPKNGRLFQNRAITLSLAAIVFSLLAICIFMLLRQANRVAGPFGLFAAAATLALSLITQDPWDLRVWQQLLDIVAFGGGSPAYAWTGTPLWAFLPGVLAPIIAAWNDVFGQVPQIVDIVTLKIALWIAFSFVATQLAGLAPPAWQRSVLLVWLVSPFSLYLVSWGVRDLVSTALALLAIRQCMAKRLILGTLAVGAAASIDEYFVPLLVLPALVYILTRERATAALVKGCGLAALAFALVAVQWIAVGPRYASSVLSFRLGVTFMDATWQFLLQSIGMLPAFVVANQQIVFIVLYVCLCSTFLARLLRLTIAGEVFTAKQAVAVALRPLSGCVGAFFLSYGQADFQEWFGLIALLQVVSFRRTRMCWLVFTLLLIAGLDLYAHLGLREYLSPALFRINDAGIWAIRSSIDHVLIATCLGFIAVAVLALATNRFARLWSDSSATVLLVWLAALLSASIEPIFSDLVLLSGALFAMFILISRVAATTSGPQNIEPRQASFLAGFLILVAVVPTTVLVLFFLAFALVLYGSARTRAAISRLTAIDWVLICSAASMQIAAPASSSMLASAGLVTVAWCFACLLILLGSGYLLSQQEADGSL